MATQDLMFFLVETLRMLSGETGEINALAKQESLTPEVIIQDYLLELEGDVYTFFSHDNLSKLNLSNQVIDLIIKLREAVENLPSEKWKVSFFISDNDWHKIHQQAKKILSIIPDKN